MTKRSTWRYFQRENELLLRWKSTRRAATSAGRRGGEAIDRAVAATATPCGSCAWMTSGCRSRMTRDSRQAAGRSTSPRGASGTTSMSAGRRFRSSPFGWATTTTRCPRARRPLRGQQHLVLAAPPRARGVDLEGEHLASALTRSCSCLRASQLPAASCLPPQLPQLRELQEHVVAVEDGHDEAHGAVPPAPAGQVVPQEGAERPRRQPRHRRPSARARAAAGPPASCTGRSSAGDARCRGRGGAAARREAVRRRPPRATPSCTSPAHVAARRSYSRS